ncbi:(4Fe-4S)-binding protein [Syntrophomonas erecta]
MQITDNVYWVGVLDKDLEVFDLLMKTPHGTSYNSYLVKGKEKSALIDTVHSGFLNEFLDNLKEIIDVEEIDYLVVNHTEPDHAGSIEKLLDLNPALTILGHPNAIEFLREVCNRDFSFKYVADGSEIELGGKTLQFINALLLHWPDTMYTYIKEDKILFSCDSFGSHYPDKRLFNDLIERDLTDDLKQYFEVILGPFKSPMRKALRRLNKYPIDMICPGHGPLLRKNIDQFLNLYRQWSENTVKGTDTRPKIVLAWLSAHGFTETLVDSVISGLASQGDYNLIKYDLVNSDPDEIAGEIEVADGFLIGSPTINKDAPPQVWSLLTRLSPLIHGNKIAGAFGAYGWSGEAVPIIESRMRMLRMKVLPGLRIRMKPTPADLERAHDFGVRFGRALGGEKNLLEYDLSFQIAVNPNNPHEFKAENYKKVYSNKDINVHWNPGQCTHDTNCFSTLSAVFNPEARPWVNIDGSDPLAIIKTVNGCPSGALKYSLPEGSSVNPEAARGPGWIGYYNK